MVEVEVTTQTLKVVLTGHDAFLFAWSRRKEIIIPMAHVQRARVGRPVGLFVKRHSGGRGGSMKCVRRTGPTLVIDLDGDPYRWMTLSVADPEDAVASIKGALRRQRW